MPIGPMTVEDMRRIEENCVGLGISKLQLMENAGKAVADRVRDLYQRSHIPANKAVVVCGLGNNGGDGFVVARHLSSEFSVHVVLVGCETALKTDEAQKNWDALRHLDYSISLHQGPAIFSPESPLNNLASYDVLIDAILGTGLLGTVREPEKSVIQLINRSKIKKLSIDVPSGDRTETMVNADSVIALHRLKTGTSVKNAIICDIGIPQEAELYTGPGDILFHRRVGSHKGENGRVLIIGGGPFTGAPALAAMAALRSGIDIVTVASPKAEIIAGFSPNLIVKEVGKERITLKDVKTLIDLISQHDSVVIGPGLGVDPETTRAVSKLISASDNLTLDADGLSSLAISEYKADSIVVTPHQGEFAALTGHTNLNGLQERIEAVKAFSREWNVITLLKGRIDIISDGMKYRLNKTGNAGMTVGGTGDVLAGLVGAFSTRLDKMQAASTAAYLNGCAGDLAFSRRGYGLLATDLIDFIPDALSRHSR
jgi:ADP-dependent NAD(P)H-hydrate dehydratase / NAD(P)H-hydrate epimerase